MTLTTEKIVENFAKGKYCLPTLDSNKPSEIEKHNLKNAEMKKKLDEDLIELFEGKYGVTGTQVLAIVDQVSEYVIFKGKTSRFRIAKRKVSADDLFAEVIETVDTMLSYNIDDLIERTEGLLRLMKNIKKQSKNKLKTT